MKISTLEYYQPYGISSYYCTEYIFHDVCHKGGTFTSKTFGQTGFHSAGRVTVITAKTLPLKVSFYMHTEQ